MATKKNNVSDSAPALTVKKPPSRSVRQRAVTRGDVPPGLMLRRLAAGLALLAALAGVTAALWQHFVANDSASCGVSLADRLMGSTGMDSRFPEVFAAYASCADAKVNLFGVPYEFWSLSLFIALALAALRVMARPN